MEPEYLDKVHGIMQGVYGDKFTLDVDTFKDKMINETQYRDKIYGIMQGVYGDKFTLDPKTFYNKVLESSKKKSQSEIGSQATQPTDGSESVQSFQGIGKAIEKNLGVTSKSDADIQAPLTEQGVKELEYRQRIKEDKDKYKIASDEQVDEAIRKNPEIVNSDKFYEGAVPEIEGIPTTLFGGKSKLEGAQKQRDYYENWDPDFESIPKQTSSFSDEDIKSNPKKYQDAALNDYLEYLKVKNGEDSQTYLGAKEKVEYYKSLGDKLYNDENYADDLKRFQDFQKQALSKIGNNEYAKALKIDNSYDWDYFSKKASDLQLKADLIDKQIKELGVSEGKVLSVSQQNKLDNLLGQYNNIQQEFSKLSEDTRIDGNVISEMSNIQNKMSKVQKSIIDIEDEDTVNAKRIKQYKEELEANKKAQEQFYNTKDSGVLETAGKGVAILGQKAASSFVEGVFSMYNVPKIVGEAFGAKGYGWTDKMSEASENINSYVDKWSPKLNTGEMTNFMSAMSQMGEGLGSVATFLAGGSTVSKFGKALNFSQKSLSTANKAGQFAVASSLSASQMYNEFLQNGFTPEEASRYALGAGVVMGLAEMMVPEDELIAKQLKGSFLSAVKSGATTKEAIQNGLEFIAKKSITMAENMRKEGTEEFVGQLAESASKQVAEFGTGKKIDGIWNPDDFTKSALAGAGTAGIIDLFKFGSETGEFSNPFKENMVGYLAENYDDMIKKLSESNPEAYDQIADRYGKLKEIYSGLKNIPAYNELSKADQDHVLAQAHTKQVILENIKQSGLDKANFKDQLDAIEEDIFLTLNKPKQNAVQEKKTLSLLKISNDGKLQSNQDFVSKRAQIERGIEDEKKTNYSDQETERRLESTSSWLQAISRGDREKAENKANELLGEYLQKQERGSDLSENNDRGGAEISSQGDNGEISKSETGEMGTRSPQEPEYDGQSNRKSSAIDESGTFQTSYDSETKGNEGKDVGISEIKRESVVQKTREMFELPFSKKSSRIARDLQKMLYEATSNKEKNEIINQIKQTFYESISKPSAEEVLPRQQGETTETGGQPQGMGPSVQGQEVTQEGKQEEVSVNREPISEDVAPEQKAKIEERNAQDEDEAVTEIYDFNDEIKSVGTKEQFKAFLRSLSPKGVFSRIAWHNSDKESLQPREGQYYTNTRRNAEETYKREFTHPAIIFGNAPQKMDFDQVQEFDINEVKSQGNDIVITDDLSPAIGAEMNYREFIPSSADQIIPIGTKENIEAFKAFVEQQKSSPIAQSNRDGIEDSSNKQDLVQKNKKKLKGETENIINFDDYELQNNRLSQEEERGRFDGGSINVEASIILDSIQRSAQKSKKKPKELKEEEENALLDFSKKTGVYINDPSSFYGEELSRGAESSIYMSPDNSHVIKVTSNEIHHENWMDFFDRIALHNAYFPETKYEVIGFAKNKRNEFSVILKQPLIQSVREATNKEIRDDLEKRGFQSKGMNRFHNSNLGIFMGDLHSGNVVISNDGNIFYIDPVIKIDSKEFSISRPTRSINERESSFNVSYKELVNKQQKTSEEANPAQEQAATTEQVTEQVTPQATPQVTPQAQETEQEVAPEEEASVETDTELESIMNEFKAAQQMEGIDKLDKMNELKEKYGEIYEKMTFIDSNFDELLDKFNAVRICNFEP